MPWLNCPGCLSLCPGPFPWTPVPVPWSLAIWMLVPVPSHATPALPCSDSRPCSHSSTCGPEMCLWTMPVPQWLRRGDFRFPASLSLPFLPPTSASCSLLGSVPQLPARSAQHPPSTIMLQLLSRELQRASIACPQLTHVLQVLLHGNRYGTLILAASAYVTKAQPCML